MIPTDVMTIAKTLALEYKGLAGDYEQFIPIAWKIYNNLKNLAV